jgi:hypothetical protein
MIVETIKRPPGLSSEVQLILDSVQEPTQSEAFERISGLLSQDLKWDYIAEIVRRHHFGPLLFQALKTIPNANCPPVFLEWLRQNCYRSVTHNLHLQAELIQLLHLFTEYEIPMMPFKGPALASILYTDIGYRPFNDLDILVHPENFLRVKDWLINRGYSPDKNSSQTEYEYTFVKDNGNLCFELHWEIRTRFMKSRLNAAYLWNRAIPQNIFGVPSWGLPPEELFLMLCQHGGEKHGWMRLKWLCDLARLINRVSLDWERLLFEAAVLHLEEPVRQGLYLLESFLNVSLPASLSRELRSDPTLISYAAIVRAHAFRCDEGMPGFSEWQSYVLTDVANHNERSIPASVLGQFVLYLKSITKPEDIDKVSAEEQIGVAASCMDSAIHRVWRLVRLFRRHGLQLWRRLL